MAARAGLFFSGLRRNGIQPQLNVPAVQGNNDVLYLHPY
jgi:hypothetical protein